MNIRIAYIAFVVGLMAIGYNIRINSFVWFSQIGLLIFLLQLIYSYRRKICVIIQTLPRDVKFIYRYINADLRMRKHKKNNLTVIKLFKERAIKYPNRPCFIFEGRIWTTSEISQYSNKIASVFQNSGYVKGDAVALMMPNRPEYIATWIGLGKIGVITALINTNLRLQSLVHCLSVANVKAIIYAEEYSNAIDEIVNSIPRIQRYKCDVSGNLVVTDGAFNLNELMSHASKDEPIVNDEPNYNDNFLYIYTSGTTGLPKAAKIPHSRFLLVECATFNMLGLRFSDIIYNPIPLYHLAGGVVGICCALTLGIPSVLKSKFSVSSYWTDCIKNNCTVSQYIGEMCRYLLSAPPKPEDSAHSIRLMVGNGMKAHIWQEFVNRFKIEQVLEIYGSSEGNANIVNVDSTVGAVGFIPSFLPKSLHPVALIRINPETCEPIRGSNGFCMRTEPNEPGMFIGMIKQGNAQREFNGYLDKEESKKKIIENVFTKGDKAFLTGDILVQDELGYLYFKDRTGDTFRWKGENVATAEVEGVVSNVAGYRDASVYGVQIPGMEGKAGMAAIVDPDNVLDFKALAEGLTRALPAYARPIFLRIVKELEITETYKLKKFNLQREGFDPTKIQDKLYFWSSKEYVPLTPEVYQDIISGVAKF